MIIEFKNMGFFKKIKKIFTKESGSSGNKETTPEQFHRTGVKINKEGKEEIDIDKVKQMY